MLRDTAFLSKQHTPPLGGNNDVLCSSGQVFLFLEEVSITKKMQSRYIMCPKACDDASCEQNVCDSHASSSTKHRYVYGASYDVLYQHAS